MPRVWRSRAAPYRDLLDLRPGFLAAPRGFVARAAFRAGFLAAAFAVFLAAGFLEALRALAVFALGFVDCFFFVELFFFGDAAFAFRVGSLPCCTNCGPGERSNHGADDRHAQRCPSHGAGNRTTKGAPSRACACITALSLYLCRPCLSPRVERNDARFCKSSCQHEVLVMHCREESPLPHLLSRTITLCL